MKSFPEFRWRVFTRCLLLLSGVVLLTACATYVAKTQISSAWVVLAIGCIAGLAASAAVALVWSQSLARQNAQLVRSIGTGSLKQAERQVENLSESLFAEVAMAWETTLEALQHAYTEKQAAASQNYDTLAELMRMLAKAVDERTAYLRGHSERVAEYSALIARELGLDAVETERIRLAALLHDVGTLGVDDFVVAKDMPLTPEEFEIVKAHTVKGAAILRPIEVLRDLIPGVELHHEALDGSGYPYGLRGDDIPLMARIITVADSFDAMTTSRPYQAAMDPEYTLEVLHRLAGKRYDGRVVGAITSLFRRGAIVVRAARPQVSFNMRDPLAEMG